MDYARSGGRPAVAKRRLKTGPLSPLPGRATVWRDLDRKTSIEDHLPALILLGFGLLATIQVLLQLSY